MRTISRIPGVNPFAPNAPFLYPLKTGCTEVQDVFKGYRNGALGTNVLIFLVNSKSILKLLILDGICNYVQNIWNKVKAREIGQDQKTLILVLSDF